MKEIRKRIREITVCVLMITLFTVGCDKKKDDNSKTLALGAAALSASRNTGTTAATYTIGGTVSDLWTSGLVLQNNAGDDVTVTAASGTTSGTFTFATKVSGAYAVTVKTQPSFATCTVSSGSGTATANVTNVSVSCATSIGGGILKALTALTGAVSVFAGPANGTTTPGDLDGTGNAARFSNAQSIATDGTNIYVSDTNNNKIRKIVIATGAVSVLAGPANGTTTAGDLDGTGTAARFNSPNAITTDGTNLYVTEGSNNKIRKVVISTGVVSVLAGPANGTTTFGDTDGTGNAARFAGPTGITTDGTNLYVADQSNNKIRKIVIATGVVTTLAGPAQGTTTAGDLDGTGNAARFGGSGLWGITTDGTNLFVAEYNNNKIRKIVIATGVVSVFAGPANGTTTSGDTDGTGTAARFSGIYNLATDGTNLYVADSSNNKIRKIVISTGVVSTLVGPAQGTTTSGDLDGTGTAVRFLSPKGIISDGTSLYVAEANNKIRKIQ